MLLNATEAAKLIEADTSRSCSRQNLETIARRGRLPKSCTTNERGHLRFDPQFLVAEYLTNVDQRQVGNKHVAPERPVTPPGPPESPEFQPNAPIRPPINAEYSEIPDYVESRARAEYEKANLLELERKKKEGELLLRVDVQKAWSDAIGASKTKLLALPTMAKQRIPHLDLEEIEILTELVREALEALASESEE